jgi:hypothetical protein
VTPDLVLGLWACGIAAGAAVVAYWRIVGPGFLWLSGGVVALFGLGAAVFEGAVPLWIGVLLALGGALVARRPVLAAGYFAASALMFFAMGVMESSIVPFVTGALLLGAMTTLMMLGHWYLVDPQLPRRALLRLDVAAGAGLLADFIYMVVVGTILEWQPADAILGWTYIALTVFTFLLVVATWYSLQEPTYSGVMAATGLSYLGLLTSFGVVVLGRVLTE